MKLRVLLVGYGKFGKEHFEVLQKLDREKQIILAGIVTKTQKLNLPKNIPTYINISPVLLKSVDVVILVTPISTHYTLVKKCLPYTHVFVEKPLAMTVSEGKKLIEAAKRNKKILAVGHIFRFNNAVEELKKILHRERKNLYNIEGAFTGGSAKPAPDCGVVTCDMHLVDILDNILGATPISIYCQGQTTIKDYPYENQASIVLYYPKNIHAYLKLGWVKGKKIRSLIFYYPEKEIHANLLTQTIRIIESGKKERILECYKKQPLRMELEGFINAVTTGTGNYITGETANRIVGITAKARESMKKNKTIYV